MEVQPFSVFSLRFDRLVDGAVVVADLRPRTIPAFAGADWDAGRDRDMDFDAPTSWLPIIAPVCRRLIVRARFLQLPAFQAWDIWAVDPCGQSVLPAVEKATVPADSPGCISAELAFRVDASRVPPKGVGRHEVTWQWYGQYVDEKGRRTGKVNDLGTTKFVVLSILAAPTSPPWRSAASQDCDEDLLHPGVLDFACRAATGSTTALGAGAALTRAVFDLGSDARRQAGWRRFVYGPLDDFACDDGHRIFRCAAFLAALDEDSTKYPASVSCEDVSTAVCVFGNALGLDLERRMIRIPGSCLVLAPVRCIGSAPDASLVWDNHIVAWSPALQGVFDACLQLNLSEDPGVERWETAAGMPFGEDVDEPDVPGYRHRLLTRHPGACRFDPLCTPVLDRAPVESCSVSDPIEERRAEYLQLLQTATPEKQVQFPLDPRTWQVTGFDLDRDNVARREWFLSALWKDRGDSGRVIALTAERTPDLKTARALAAWRLTFYREPMPPGGNPTFPGAIVFATQGGQRMLLLWANGVVQLRGDGLGTDPLSSIFGPVLGPILTP